MIPMLYCVLTALFVVFLTWWRLSDPLRHIPGPKSLPLVGNSLDLKNTKQNHLVFEQWGQMFKDVFKVKLFGGTTVVLNSYASIHDALLGINNGYDTAGRIPYWRSTYLFEETGIAASTNPSQIWKILRKLAHRHIKQFGDGLPHIEQIIANVMGDMFSKIERHGNGALDPQEIINETVVRSIAILLTGENIKADEQLLLEIERYEDLFMKYAEPVVPLHIMIYDWIQWLRHLKLKGWQQLNEVLQTENKIWNILIEKANTHPVTPNLVKLLLAQQEVNVKNEGGTEQLLAITEIDAKKTCSFTTSTTFYCLINILAHLRNVQQSIQNEIKNAVGDDHVIIQDRSRLPFSRATVLEVLRYITTVPLGATHRALKDVNIQGYNIPKDTPLFLNLWALHHDPDFWDKPNEFHPERFLCDNGDLEQDHECVWVKAWQWLDSFC